MADYKRQDEAVFHLWHFKNKYKQV